MIPDCIQKRRILSLILAICMIYVSVPLNIEHFGAVASGKTENAIVEPANEINDNGIVIQTFECVGIIQIFCVLDAFAILEPGTYFSQEFLNIVRKKKRRPQMARQNLNEETEHLF